MMREPTGTLQQFSKKNLLFTMQTSKNGGLTGQLQIQKPFVKSVYMGPPDFP